MPDNDALQKELKQLREDLTDLEIYVEELNSFLPLAMCVINPAKVVINVNSAFEILTEYEHSEIVGKSFNILFEDDEKTQELLEKTKASDDTRQKEEFQLQTKSDEIVAVNVTSAQRLSRDGDHLGFFIGITDISDLKSFQAKLEKRVQERTKNLQETQEQLRQTLSDVQEEKQKNTAIIQNLTDGLVMFDPDGTLELINPPAQEILDADESEVLGMTRANLRERNRFKMLLDFIDQARPLDQREEFEMGEDFILEVSTVQVETEDTETSPELIILHDVTEEKKVEKMKMEFISVAAHQMRTPLSAIQWSFELLTNELEDEGLMKSAVRGLQSSQRIIRIVNELLSVDKIEAGKTTYDFEVVDITQLVSDYVQSVRENSTFLKQANLSYIQPAEVPLMVRGDKEKLNIVIQNLIENALKYTDEDGTVEVRVENESGMARLEVEDTGIGIPKDEQDKVFSKFYRAQNAVQKETDGTGVGLFITKKIIDKHDGKIAFKSRENEGTTFVVTLPLA